MVCRYDFLVVSDRLATGSWPISAKIPKQRGFQTYRCVFLQFRPSSPPEVDLIEIRLESPKLWFFFKHERLRNIQYPFESEGGRGLFVLHKSSLVIPWQQPLKWKDHPFFKWKHTRVVCLCAIVKIKTQRLIQSTVGTTDETRPERRNRTGRGDFQEYEPLISMYF